MPLWYLCMPRGYCDLVDINFYNDTFIRTYNDVHMISGKKTAWNKKRINPTNQNHFIAAWINRSTMQKCSRNERYSIQNGNILWLICCGASIGVTCVDCVFEYNFQLIFAFSGFLEKKKKTINFIFTLIHLSRSIQ